MSPVSSASPRTDQAGIDPRFITAAMDAIRRRAGLVFPAARHAGFETAVGRVMKTAGVSNLTTMIALINERGPVFDDLVAAVTIGESYFFREPAQFALIRDRIVPELRSTSPSRRIRAWSAAASTGEEAYSLAITLREQSVDCDVVATDVSRPRLRSARHGSFRQWSFRGVPDTTIDRWFTRTDDRFILDPTIRSSVDFRYLNLAEDSYPSMATGVWGMDLILCRNVLIYFDPPTIAHVAARLIDSLSEDGWLLLGASDPAIGEFLAVEIVDTPAGVAYRRSRPGNGDKPVSRPYPQPAVVVTYPDTADELVQSTEPDHSAEVLTAALPEVAPASDDGAIAAAYAAHDYAEVVRLADVASDRATIADEALVIRALANLGQLEPAGRNCAIALDRHRDVPELHYLHSILLMEGGRPADAASAARRALYLDRGLVVAHLALATASARSNDVPGAKRALGAAERLLAKMPANAMVPGSDGESAGRLLSMSHAQLRLLGEPAA